MLLRIALGLRDVLEVADLYETSRQTIDVRHPLGAAPCQILIVWMDENPTPENALLRQQRCGLLISIG